MNLLPEPPPPPSPQLTVPWTVLWIVLLAPALLTVASVLFGAKETAVTLTVVGGAISGIWCGIMLACRVGRTAPTKVALGIVFSLLLAFLSMLLAGIGCLASGYSINIH